MATKDRRSRWLCSLDFGPADEEFLVAFFAFDRGGALSVEGGSLQFLQGEILGFLEDALVDVGVADDPFAFVGFLFGGFELGLDQGDEVASGWSKVGGGENQFGEMKERSRTMMLYWSWGGRRVGGGGRWS